MLTFGDVKTDTGILNVSRYAPDSPEFADLLLAVVRRAMRRGDFSGTLIPIYVCARAGCVVWPSFVSSVRAVSNCGGTFETQNMWGSFLPRSMGSPWRHGQNWFRGPELERAMVSQGRSSVYQDIQGEGRLVRAYYRCNKDLGKTITIFGTDNGGQMLQHVDALGNILPGVVLTLAAPFASTSVYVRHIDYVLLDEMDCPVNLFAYNATTNLLEDIAQYEPGETRPSFDRTRITIPTFFGSGLGISGGGCATGTCGGTKSGLNALVKIRYPQRFRFDTDLVPIDNLDAIKLLIQSIKFGEAGDRTNAKEFEADAVFELNRQLEDDNADSDFAASNEVFGAGITFTNHVF
jgi:hypothetical protein